MPIGDKGCLSNRKRYGYPLERKADDADARKIFAAAQNVRVAQTELCELRPEVSTTGYYERYPRLAKRRGIGGRIGECACAALRHRPVPTSRKGCLTCEDSSRCRTNDSTIDQSRLCIFGTPKGARYRYDMQFRQTTVI